MKGRKVRVGVVGVGHLGFQHARIVHQLEHAELVGVFDINFRRAQHVAERWGTKAFRSLEELLREVEAVSCVVPTSSHYEVGKKILEHGLHLFLEKPMTETVEQAEELVKLAGDKGVKFQIGHIERFNPAVLAVHQFINSPKFIESHRLAPYNPRGTDVDVVLDLMIHDLDLILFYLGKEPVKVEAVGVPVITDKVDIANARLEFDDGEIANVTASRISVEKLRKIRMFQKDMYISIDYLHRDVEFYRRYGDEIIPFFPEVNKNLEPLKLELESFVSSIIDDKTPPVTGMDGLRALRVALRVKEDISRRIHNFI